MKPRNKGGQKWALHRRPKYQKHNSTYGQWMSLTAPTSAARQYLLYSSSNRQDLRTQNVYQVPGTAQTIYGPADHAMVGHFHEVFHGAATMIPTKSVHHHVSKQWASSYASMLHFHERRRLRMSAMDQLSSQPRNGGAACKSARTHSQQGLVCLSNHHRRSTNGHEDSCWGGACSLRRRDLDVLFRRAR